MSKHPHVLAIVGPTASGKSALADALASQIGSAVVSIDSMQVYRGMDIGTAKTPLDQRSCDLLMVDVCNISDCYSVQLFQTQARSCIDNLLHDDHLPVLCGGTGLYLDAVIDEMSFPSGTQQSPSRKLYERYAQEQGSRALYDLLAKRDPRSAELIHPNNIRRTIRALELLDEGISYADTHEGLKAHKPHYNALIIGLQMNRERLYQRINDRVDEMFDAGLVQEVRRLLSCGLQENVTAAQAIGYKEVSCALKGECSLEEAKEAMKARSRRYAKRQLSWLRRDGRTHWLDMDELNMTSAISKVLGLAESFWSADTERDHDSL